ncbi:hypothetical protein [Bacillus toyonensis]|uniref:hypothetical protein n=1 Tax=Bacillus toyonensis TaxID=155322 RepID=UPI000BFA8847|nr:hypothetical protein [Bacillus toyonensis]PGF05089.1 hypothetical protein COM61_01275 [Bacillus toyonensis]
MKTSKAYEVGLILENKGGMQGDLYVITVNKTTVEAVKEYLNKYYTEDTVVYIKETTLVEGKTLLSELEEGVSVETLAFSDTSNSTSQFTKHGDWVYIQPKGLDFSDGVFIYKFIPSKFLELAIAEGEYEAEWLDINNPTLTQIDELGILVYESLNGMSELSEKIEGVAEIVVNNNFEKKEETEGNIEFN